jgi:hypothetical protein
MPRVESRTILFACATVAFFAVLAYISGGSSTASDTLPAGLTDREFWQMIVDFSEPDGYFRSDNFLSNEIGYQSVIPMLHRTLQPGGVYLGVGPEQNFTYVAALEPKMAFIVDIRRQNMIEHLIYKALMEMSHDRGEFLSRLFSRPRPAVLNSDSSAEALVRAYEEVQASPNLFSTNVRSVLEHLGQTHRFQLSAEDEASVRYVYRAFFESGPELSYTFVGGYRGFMGMPTYAQLMTEHDGHSRNWNFLASENQFHIVQRLQKSNLIVPLVGDFAGPKAIRSVGQFLKKHNAVVSVFYTSNVEQYLFQDEDKWKRFYANSSTLPLDSSSTFIRYVLNSWGFARSSRTLLSRIKDVVQAYNTGQVHTYYDIVEMSR